MAFDLIQMDHKQIFKDNKQLEIIQDSRKEEVILKPDKGDSIVRIRFLLTITTYSKITFLTRVNSNKLKEILQQHALHECKGIQNN